VRTENEILEMHEESKAQSEVLTLFENLFISATPSTQFKPTRTLQIWFGDTYREGFSEEYLALRDKLSDAAYQGDFDQVFDVLKIADQIYGECWVNAPRLGKKTPRSHLACSRAYTPRHRPQVHLRVDTTSPGCFHECIFFRCATFARAWSVK
jgi:hypothetical protein